MITLHTVTKHSLNYLALNVKFVFLLSVWLAYFQNVVKNLAFRDKFNILLEKSPRGLAEQEYARLYGRS
jgi:hypothetical protein